MENFEKTNFSFWKFGREEKGKWAQSWAN